MVTAAAAIIRHHLLHKHNYTQTCRTNHFQGFELDLSSKKTLSPQLQADVGGASRAVLKEPTGREGTAFYIEIACGSSQLDSATQKIPLPPIPVYFTSYFKSLLGHNESLNPTS